jgi:hypothetical protein
MSGPASFPKFISFSFSIEHGLGKKRSGAVVRVSTALKSEKIMLDSNRSWAVARIQLINTKLPLFLSTFCSPLGEIYLLVRIREGRDDSRGE